MREEKILCVKLYLKLKNVKEMEMGILNNYYKLSFLLLSPAILKMRYHYKIYVLLSF